MDRFAVRLELATPVLLRGWMTLDAVLAALVFDRTGSVERAHSEIPLARTGGLWHGSAAFFEDAQPLRRGFVASVRHEQDLDPDQLARNRSGALPKMGPTRRREYGNVAGRHPGVSTRGLWWFAEGDAEAVEALLAGVEFVGKKRDMGYGRVTRVDLAHARTDGIHDPDGYPLRPVPRDLWRGSADAVVGDEAWRPTYWDWRNRAACVVPASVHRSRDALEAWLG